MGELNLTAALFGENNLSFGVGESNLTLLGNKDEYKLEIEKGIGRITVDGNETGNFSSGGNGERALKIKGGVGTINIAFQEE
jgi:hypothetical protein